MPNSASNARSTPRGCSIPARCSRNCIVAPNWVACTFRAARCRSRTCRGSDVSHALSSLSLNCRDPFVTDVLKPADIHQAEEAVRWAVGNDKTLELVGSGSKRALGRPSQTDITLDLSSFTGVTLYEPDELILSARAGTPLAEIEALLHNNTQQLDFAPMDYGPLLGPGAGQGTIGGVLAAT